MGSMACNAVKRNGFLVAIIPANVNRIWRVRRVVDLRNDEVPFVCIAIVAGQVVHMNGLIAWHLRWQSRGARYRRHGWRVRSSGCRGIFFRCRLGLCGGNLGRLRPNGRVHVGLAGYYRQRRGCAYRLWGYGVAAVACPDRVACSFILAVFIGGWRSVGIVARCLCSDRRKAPAYLKSSRHARSNEHC
jgi:hypothetical protein